MQVTIREAGLDDAAAIAPLLDELGYPTTTEQARRRLRSLRADPGTRVFVAVVGDEIAGLAGAQVAPVLEHDAPPCRLIALVVSDRFRRKGVGAALVTAVEAEARARGCPAVVLTTARNRHDAHAFYRRLGYEDTGLRFIRWLDQGGPAAPAHG